MFRFCLEFGNVVLIEYSQQYVKPSHPEVVASGVDEAGADQNSQQYVKPSPLEVVASVVDEAGAEIVIHPKIYRFPSSSPF